MQSTESPSSQLSQDSLSSNNSFVFSDDFFLLEDRDRPHGAHSTHSSLSNRSVCSMNEEEERPGSQWMCDEFSDHEKSPDNSLSRSASLSISAFLSFSSSSSSGLGCSSSKSKQRKNGVTEGDLIFAHKCLELQGFVQPLLELLNGLKKGRFDKGLSSFQQSVAMDRIQRIVGVLQKPHIGERYLPTLLKIEAMLKLWFPQVNNQVSVTPNPADLSPHNFFTHGINNNTSPHRQKDQLHIPVKKRRLSWSDTDSCSSSPPVMCKHSKVKCFNEHHPWPHVDGGEGSSRISSITSHANQTEEQNGETPLHKVIQWSSSKLTWVHIAPIFSPPKSGLSHMGGIAKNRGIGSVLLPISPLISRSSPAMQDSYVSSTTSFSALTGCQCQSVHLGKTCPCKIVSTCQQPQ